MHEEKKTLSPIYFSIYLLSTFLNDPFHFSTVSANVYFRNQLHIAEGNNLFFSFKKKHWALLQLVLT
jgi:hypothetical protein